MNEEPYSIFGIALLATQAKSKNGKNICLNFTGVRAGKIVAQTHGRPYIQLGILNQRPQVGQYICRRTSVNC